MTPEEIVEIYGDLDVAANGCRHFDGSTHRTICHECFEKAIRAAVEAERERAAKIAASYSPPLDINNPTISTGGLDIPAQIAAAIRAWAEQTEKTL